MPAREKFGRGLRAEVGFREGEKVMDMTCLWFDDIDALKKFVCQDSTSFCVSI
jgi:hypothetical protein